MLVYDGDCKFCVSRAKWFQRRARKSSKSDLARSDLSISGSTSSGSSSSDSSSTDSSSSSSNKGDSNQTSTAVAWQDLDLAEVGLTEDIVTREAVWIDAEGQKFTGHAAVAKSLIYIGGLWGVAGRLLLLPPFSWIARPIYRLIATNRR